MWNCSLATLVVKNVLPLTLQFLSTDRPFTDADYNVIVGMWSRDVCVESNWLRPEQFMQWWSKVRGRGSFPPTLGSSR